MDLLTAGKTVFALIFALAITSSVNSQCCDFETTPCTWNTGPWLASSPSLTPDLRNYANFTATQPSETYMYLQDQQGSLISNTPYTIPSEGTVISLDYFLSSPSGNSKDTLQVYFSNKVTSFSAILLYEQARDSGWRHLDVQCDSSNSYCCGSLSELPCEGQIQVTGYVDSANPQALFAIDNIGICKSVIPTLPPPNPSPCCQFEADICGITASDWYWSSQKVPSSTIPKHSGEYFWTNVTSGFFKSSILTGVTPDTAFSIVYYISGNVTVNIHFKPTGRTDVLIAVLNHTGQAFESYRASCGTCCGGGTCDGQAFLTVTSTSEITEPFIVAVDDIERDSACQASMPCCYFDDVYMCGFNSKNIYYPWKFDGTDPPDTEYIEIPSPGSNYVYFELTNYYDPVELNVVLASQDMVVDNTVVFRASLFLSIKYASYSGQLDVNFVNKNTGESVQLDYVTDTGSTWKLFEFRCDTPHGSCCPTTDNCTGHVEIVASAQAYMGGVAIYAVNAFEINGTCSVFPGHNVKESNFKRAIEFQPKIV